MSPRARRSDSVTLPPGNQPGLIRYNDEKYAENYTNPEESDDASSAVDESNFDSATDDSYDVNDFNDYDSDSESDSTPLVMERRGR